MARKNISYSDIMKMADDYGVSTNPLFVSAAERYAIQIDVIRMMYDDLKASGKMTVKKEYVRDRGNVQPNPLLDKIAKGNDSANKTLATMMDIIERLGTPKHGGDRFGDVDE